MKKRTLMLLHVCYWLGAVIDLVAGLIMVVPTFYSTVNKLTVFTPTQAFTNVAWMGAPLMFGWTVLLLWADRKPLERKAVLLITLIPILGNALNQVASYSSGFYPLEVAIQQWLLQAFLVILFVIGYWQAEKLSRIEEAAGKDK